LRHAVEIRNEAIGLPSGENVGDQQPVTFAKRVTEVSRSSAAEDEFAAATSGAVRSKAKQNSNGYSFFIFFLQPH
jgi:hypothetical protein